MTLPWSESDIGEGLANIAHARRTDPATSHQAAESVTGMRASQSAVLAVFAALRHSGGMTDEQLAEQYDYLFQTPQQSPSGLRTRRKELVDAGYLEDSGQRRAMTTGRKAIVWQLATRTAGTATAGGTQPEPAPGYETGEVPAVLPGQTTIDDFLGGDDA